MKAFHLLEIVKGVWYILCIGPPPFRPGPLEERPEVFLFQRKNRQPYPAAAMQLTSVGMDGPTCYPMFIMFTRRIKIKIIIAQLIK